MPAFWRDTDRSPVPVQEAISEWALVAWDVLEGVAGRWRRTLTPADLGGEVQRRSDIHTEMPVESWINTVLSLVAQRAHESQGPALTALVVDEAGRVGDGYREVLRLQGRAAFSDSDLQEHARESMAECNRAYEAKMPASVARGTAGPRRRAASVAKKTAGARPTQPTPKMCPHCFLQLPATGVCDNCD